MTTNKNIYVFGEIHSNAKNVASITKRIREIKPDYILHELLYDDVCLNTSEVEQRLKECKEGGVCDPSLNKDIYTLGLMLDAKLVGIDLDNPDLTHLSIKDQFQKREMHMKQIIERHLELKDNPVVVIVVGDTHLREKQSPELGKPSILAELFRNNPRVILERAPLALQEMV